MQDNFINEEKSSFINNLSTTISSCSREIAEMFGYASFNDFQDNESKKHKGPCPNYWREPMLCVKCDNCSKTISSIFCLQCFLNGNHKNHSIIVEKSNHGFCDCGNELYTDPAGHCCKHAQIKNNENMNEDKKNVVVHILSRVLDKLPDIVENEEQFCEIMNWLISICQIGRSFGNCVITALEKKDTLNNLFKVDFPKYTKNEIKAIQKLINQLIVNPLFYNQFGRAVYSNIFKFIDYYNNCMNESKNFDDIQPLTESFFTVYKFDFFLNSYKGNILILVDFIDIVQNQIKCSIAKNTIYIIPRFLNDLFYDLGESSNMIELDNSFLCKYLDTILDKNFILTTSIGDNDENLYKIYNLYFCWLINFVRKTFENNINFDIDMIIEKYYNYYRCLDLNYSIIDRSPVLLNYIPVLSLYYSLKSRSDVKCILKDRNDFLKYLIMNLIKIIVPNFFQAHNIIPGSFNLINYSLLLFYYYDDCLSIIKFIQLCFSCYQNK